MVKKFRQARVADRFVKERDKKAHTLGMLRPGGENNRCPDALSFEQLGSCASLIMEFARKKAWDLPKNIYEVKGTYIQAYENIFRPPNSNSLEKVIASHSD